MLNQIVIATVSALVGGLITIVITYLNNKAKRFELEYSYRKKLEERYLLNAQKHLNDVYIPLYSKLIVFQNNWTRLKTSNNFQNLKSEITESENFKKGLEERGLTAFLTPEIENSFDHLLEFLSKSQDASEIRYGIITRYKIFGQEKSFYRVVPEKIRRKRINFYRYIMLIRVFFGHISWMRIAGFLDYELEIVVDSAPLNSEAFDNQLLKFLTDIKEKIKDITLGTK